MSIDPNKTALLSMDFQNGVVGMVDDSDSLIARQKQAIETARKKGVTIAHVRVAFADGEAPAGQMGKRIPPEMIANFHADSPNTQHHDELAPAPGDIAVRKVRVGPFSTTDLHEQLQA
ncbi:MAG: isochorismatase family protein, partial [Solirubrobacterales bacterium]|nr:isochorismatase family protein [Solirubrobacterales bacterium]